MSTTLKTSLKNKIRDSVEIPVLTRCCFCFPLRKGVIAFAYINLILTLIVTSFLSIYIYNGLKTDHISFSSEYARLTAAAIVLSLEVVMTIAFIVALHKKYVLIMKVFLYFEIIFIIVYGFIYGLSYFTILQVYLAILVWSSIVETGKDPSVKYPKETCLA